MSNYGNNLLFTASRTAYFGTTSPANKKESFKALAYGIQVHLLLVNGFATIPYPTPVSVIMLHQKPPGISVKALCPSGYSAT